MNHLKPDSSPCLRCWRVDDDKSECALTCRELREWQLRDDPSMAGMLTRRPIRMDDCQVRQGFCMIDAKRLRWDKGVLYCPECLTVYERGDSANKLEAGKRWFRQGWELDAVERVLQVGPKQVEFMLREARGLV